MQYTVAGAVHGSEAPLISPLSGVRLNRRRTLSAGRAAHLLVLEGGRACALQQLRTAGIPRSLHGGLMLRHLLLLEQNLVLRHLVLVVPVVNLPPTRVCVLSVCFLLLPLAWRFLLCPASYTELLGDG